MQQSASHRRDDARALRESEERYRLIVEGARDYAIISMDPEGCVTSWSPGAEAVFGWAAPEVLGQPVDVTFVPEERAAGVPAEEQRRARESGTAPDVRWHVRKDGARVFIEGTTRALRDDAGRLRGYVKIGQDVTRRRETEQALRASEARFRTLVENVRDYAILLLDARGIITEWPLGAQRVTGHASAEVLGRHLSVLYPPESIAEGEPERELAEAAETGRAEREGWRMRRDGSRFWVNEVVTAAHDTDGNLVGFTKVSRDLTERRLAEQAAERARAEAERTTLRRQLAAAEEEERRRLSRELHDQLGQQLTAFTLGLAEATRLAAEAGGAAGAIVQRLSQLEALARNMTIAMRDLALALRPPELDDLGFASATETYVADWSARYRVAADVAMTGVDGDGVPGNVGTTLYRIMQEALTNVARHADASHVSVILEKGAREVLLVIEDDGRGFDVGSTLERARRERRLGLASMRERVELEAGTLGVESRPGSGTTLYVRVPLDDDGPG